MILEALFGISLGMGGIILAWMISEIFS